MTDSQETGKTLWVACEHGASGPVCVYNNVGCIGGHEASPSEIIEAALNDFPSDEDVEAGVNLVAEKYGERLRGPADIWLVDPRALVRDILAIADTRRTEEEG